MKANKEELSRTISVLRELSVATSELRGHYALPKGVVTQGNVVDAMILLELRGIRSDLRLGLERVAEAVRCLER